MKSYHILFLLLPLLSMAQRIDNTASFRDIKKDSYFRFHYDNDFFTATDLYYTQGYTFELVTPWLGKNPVNHILLEFKGSEARYGLTFEQTGFIPTDITDDEIRYGDRPYAATIALKSFLISTDTVSRSRLVSSLTVGMIGPAAFGDEMQTGIHKLIDDDLPQGWQYQINNDIILDYQLGFEKELLRLNDIFSVTSNTRLRLGTLNTNAATGFNITLGLINRPFTSVKNKNKFQAYLFSQPMGSLIGYDATLQGGLFNDKSPYTIPDGDVERFTLQHNYGIIIQYRSLFFEASKAEITREFKNGHSHRWGGFKIGFKI